MLDRDAGGALAGGARRQHEFAHPDALGRAARDAGEDRHVVEADREHRIAGARPERRRQHHRREHGGKGEQEIAHAHDRFVDPAASRGGE